MLPLLAALVFMFGLGKKLLVPVRWTGALSVLLVALYLFGVISAVPVLVTLFVASPFLIHLRYSDKANTLFGLCVVVPLIVEVIR
ncbi:hypothetical protein KW538_01405 [Vibrio fluvialis]|nr:hypothetical protein [Vibrio fluvialis]